MKEKKESENKLLVDILSAEQIAKEGMQKAENEAKKIIEKAGVMSENMRDKSVAKLKTETEKLNADFALKTEEQKLRATEDAKAEINKLLKNLDTKKQEIATQIVKEILTECQL